jgi:succinate dehydrogenase/fumarate reductase flavoprotein subunit
MACVPHNYLLGAMTYGEICAENALLHARASAPADRAELADQVEAERARLEAPLLRPRGVPPHQYEYKVRRLVNDYLQPPKAAARMEHGLALFERAAEELEALSAQSPHELMRFAEAGFIRDCAEMAARASLFRTESRWGLYHYRLDHPELDDENWLVHVNLRKRADGAMEALKRPLAPYVVPLDDDERRSYYHIRVPATAAARQEVRP